MRLNVVFEDVAARRLSHGILYLLLFVLLGRDIEWIRVVSSVLSGIAGVWLIVRVVLLFCGKAEPKCGSARSKAGFDWVFPGYMLVYALVVYMQGIMPAMWAFLALAVVSAMGAVFGVICSKKER